MPYAVRGGEDSREIGSEGLTSGPRISLGERKPSKRGILTHINIQSYLYVCIWTQRHDIF
jgi:hypothetical protein